MSLPVMYEKLPDLTNRVLNKNSRFQHLILLILCFNFFLNAISITISLFYSYQPDFRCGELDINQCNSNGTCPNKYEYYPDEQTVVSEWSLVCSQRLLGPTISTLYFLGSMFTLFFGSIADWFGKKRVLFFCVYMDVICFIGLSFVSKVEWFIVIRMFQGFCNQVSLIVVYPLSMEYCPPKHRTIVGLAFELMWATGLIYLGVVEYSLKDWRNIQLVLAIPGLLTLVWFWIIPESIQWLCSKQKHEEAFQLLVVIAKRNGNYHEIEEEHRHWVELNMNKKSDNNVSHSDIKKDFTGFNSSWHITRTIFSTSFLRKHILIMSATWFIVTLSYYSVLFCMPTLIDDRHLNFLIGAGIEFCVYICMYFVLSRFGRPKPMMIYFIVNGIILGLIGWLTAFPQNEYFVMATTLISRGVSSSLYYAMELYAVELFPVANQSFALGICVFAKQIGNMVAPMLLPLFDATPIIPMLILGLLSILTGTGYIFLPETLNIRIPTSVEEARAIWK